jgi:hypothetical protein
LHRIKASALQLRIQPRDLAALQKKSAEIDGFSAAQSQ